MSQVNTNMSDSTEKKCAGKAIYSELNYEKLRKQRLNKVDTYYKKVLDKYEQNKRTYNQQFLSTAKQADNMTSEMKNKLSPNSTPDQKQEAEQSIKPVVVRLNKQLLNIAQAVLKDNTETAKGLAQQYVDLSEQEKRLDKIIDEVSVLESDIEKQKHTQLSRKTMLGNSQEVGQSSYYWYIALSVINIILLLGIVIYIIMIVASGMSNSSSNSTRFNSINNNSRPNSRTNNRPNSRPNSRTNNNRYY